MSASPSETLLCQCGDPECPGGIPIRSPFYFKAEQFDEGENSVEYYLSVRTSSWEWSGERTDIHDIFSLLWAAQLRIEEIASTQLVSILNAFSRIESEIYARLLIFSQPGHFADPMTVRERFALLGAESIAANALVQDVFGVDSSGSPELAFADDEWLPDPGWIEPVRKYLRLRKGRGYEVRSREPFRWNVFTSLNRGISVGDFGSDATSRLRERFSAFRPAIADGVGRRVFRTERLVNAVSFDTLKKAERLFGFVGDDAASSICIPLDSHTIFLGRRAMISLAEPGGSAAFADERLCIEARQEKEADVFLQDARCVWAKKIDDGRFEDLVRALIETERGVHWIRQVGATREADDGRDFIVEWSLPPGSSRTLRRGESEVLTERRDVLVQVKVRESGVGRHHMGGLRDTVEHHQCSGLLVVAYPRVTTSLFNHLHDLRRRSYWWVDWWGQAEIEVRLRLHPEIARRFDDLVQLVRPA